MEDYSLRQATELAHHYLQQATGGLIDGRMLLQATLAGYLAGSGVPTDEAVAQVERMVAKNLVGPVPANPMYHGLPWLVPGPCSGAPYYQ